MLNIQVKNFMTRFPNFHEMHDSDHLFELYTLLTDTDNTTFGNGSIDTLAWARAEILSPAMYDRMIREVEKRSEKQREQREADALSKAREQESSRERQDMED